MSQPPPIDETEVEARAAGVGLTIAATSRAAVAQHLTALLVAARLVEDFPLPETNEPAPRFEP